MAGHVPPTPWRHVPHAPCVSPELARSASGAADSVASAA